MRIRRRHNNDRDSDQNESGGLSRRLVPKHADLAIGDIHRDFKAKTQVGELRGGPLHIVVSLIDEPPWRGMRRPE
jgi:hypothetical protein